MYKRTLSGHLPRIARNFPVVLVTGPRQVGKTTLLENFAAGKYHIVTLDNLDDREQAIRDPALFLQNHRPPVLIDEVQYAPGLFSYIKIYVDSHRGEKGLFLLTGSRKFSLMKGVRETLAGRVAILDLLGLSDGEKYRNAVSEPFLPTDDMIAGLGGAATEARTVSDVYSDIWNGSFPELAARNGEDRDIYYSSYMQTYIERDVRDSCAISDQIAFKNFIRAVAARTGQLLNISDIARDVAVDNKTAKAWLGILEMSGLAYLLHPYGNNMTSRIVKTPKVYFLDTGLCSYLTGWDSPKTLEAGAMSGAILETHVMAEILKSYWHNAKEAPVCFYRDRDGREVDFVIERNGTLYPVEVRKTMSPATNAGRNSGALERLGKPLAKSVVLSMKPEVSFLARDIVSIPVWLV